MYVHTLTHKHNEVSDRTFIKKLISILKLANVASSFVYLYLKPCWLKVRVELNLIVNISENKKKKQNKAEIWHVVLIYLDRLKGWCKSQLPPHSPRMVRSWLYTSPAASVSRLWCLDRRAPSLGVLWLQQPHCVQENDKNNLTLCLVCVFSMKSETVNGRNHIILLKTTYWEGTLFSGVHKMANTHNAMHAYLNFNTEEWHVRMIV